MYKLLVIARALTIHGVSIANNTIEFQSSCSADLAYDKILAGKIDSRVSISLIKLYCAV